MVTTPLEQPRKSPLAAWFKVALCFLGYFVLWEVVKQCETSHVFTYTGSRSFLLLVTTILLFLAVLVIFKPSFKK